MRNNGRFPDTQFQLADGMRETILHALRVAAEKYDENARVADPNCQMEALRRLARQFQDQSAELREIIARLEQADKILIGRVELETGDDQS